MNAIMATVSPPTIALANVANNIETPIRKNG
jgi:hypothetical protein